MSVLKQLISSGCDIFRLAQNVLDLIFVCVGGLFVLADHLIDSTKNTLLLAAKLCILYNKIKYYMSRTREPNVIGALQF